MLFGIISSDWWQRNPVRNNIKANDDNFSCVLCVLNQQSIRTAAILGLCPVEDAFLPHTVNNTVVKFGSNLAWFLWTVDTDCPLLHSWVADAALRAATFSCKRNKALMSELFFILSLAIFSWKSLSRVLTTPMFTFTGKCSEHPYKTFQSNTSFEVTKMALGCTIDMGNSCACTVPHMMWYTLHIIYIYIYL